MVTTAEKNPRPLRDLYGPYVGKKVMIGLNSYHYISCRVVGVQALMLDVTVNGKPMQVPVDDIANITEAIEETAEYVK